MRQTWTMKHMGSVQFPSLIGLPTQCLLPITAESQHRQTGTLAGWWTTVGQIIENFRTKYDWAGILNDIFTGSVWLLSVVEEIKTLQVNLSSFYLNKRIAFLFELILDSSVTVRHIYKPIYAAKI